MISFIQKSKLAILLTACVLTIPGPI